MTTINRRVLLFAIPLFALQLPACNDVLAPDHSHAGPQFLIGDSPLVPFSISKAPVLQTKQAASGKVDRQLVVELHLAAAETDALEQGKRAWQSSGGFWLSGDAIALADPRPSPVIGLFDQKDGTSLVVIAMPIDDTTWRQIDAAASRGQTVGIAMDIDLLGIDGRGATYTIHSVDVAGSFVM